MTIMESFLLPDNVHTAESSDYDGEDLQSRTAEVIESGSGNSKLRAAEALTEHVCASGDWGSILGDPIIATAILDRLLPPRGQEG